MKSNFTDITVVLDRSGSMSTVEKDTIGGFNQFIKDQKNVKGSANLTLVQFDTEYEFVHRAMPIETIPALEFHPRGGTALLDAIGRAIHETGERLRNIPEYDRPSKVIFVILTDGEENSSKEYTKEKINKMITHQRDIYKWEFVFLGANQDAIGEAAKIGIFANNAMTYAATAGGISAAFATTSSNMASFRCGEALNMSYSSSDRKKAVEEE